MFLHRHILRAITFLFFYWRSCEGAFFCRMSWRFYWYHFGIHRTFWSLFIQCTVFFYFYALFHCDPMITDIIHSSRLLSCYLLCQLSFRALDPAPGWGLMPWCARQPRGHNLASGCHGNHQHPMIPLQECQWGSNHLDVLSLLTAASKGLNARGRDNYPSQALEQEPGY